MYWMITGNKTCPIGGCQAISGIQPARFPVKLLCIVLSVLTFQCGHMKKLQNQSGADDGETGIRAEIIFRSEDGRNPLTATITSANIREYLPGKASVESVRAYFLGSGFRFSYTSGISATINASKQDFERLFKIRLTEQDGRYLVDKSPEPESIPVDVLPDPLKKDIVAITLPDKMETF